jgi:putative flippase GtrA
MMRSSFVAQSSRLQVKSTIRIEEGAFTPNSKRQGIIWQILRFGVTGGCNAGIDILALNILLWRFPTQNPAILLLYNTLAYALGALNSYLLNKYWTFRRGQGVTGDELARFITINVIGILCNDAIFWLIAKEQSFYPLFASSLLLTNLCKLGAIIGTAGISYIGMHLWVFKHTTHRHESD